MVYFYLYSAAESGCAGVYLPNDPLKVKYEDDDCDCEVACGPRSLSSGAARGGRRERDPLQGLLAQVPSQWYLMIRTVGWRDADC